MRKTKIIGRKRRKITREKKLYIFTRCLLVVLTIFMAFFLFWTPADQMIVTSVHVSILGEKNCLSVRTSYVVLVCYQQQSNGNVHNIKIVWTCMMVCLNVFHGFTFLLQYKVLYFIFVSFKYIFFVGFLVRTLLGELNWREGTKLKLGSMLGMIWEKVQQKYMKTEREMRCDLTTPKRKPNHDDIDTMDVWEVFSAFVVVRCGLHFYFNFFFSFARFFSLSDRMRFLYPTDASEDWVWDGGCQ